MTLGQERRGFVVAGTDEAGRGPLAGPVVAAAAILTVSQRDILLENGLTDSKKLAEKKRESLFGLINELGVLWRAQAASPARIDKMNILRASLWCMLRSVEKLYIRPDLVLVDGSQRVPSLLTPQKCVVKGDSKVPAIAAASIVAKVIRDRAMTVLDAKYPQYGFASHKGYPSEYHRAALREYGPCPIHRASFRGVIWREQA